MILDLNLKFTRRKCGNYRNIGDDRECARTKGQGQGYHGNMLWKVLMIQLGLLKQTLQKPRLCNIYPFHGLTALSTMSVSHFLKETSILPLTESHVAQTQLLARTQISCSTHATFCWLDYIYVTCHRRQHSPVHEGSKRLKVTMIWSYDTHPLPYENESDD